MANLDRQLSRADAEDQSLLAEIQGNILKGHGRSHSKIVLLRLRDLGDLARSWISEKAHDGLISSALSQIQASVAHRKGKDGGGFAVLSLSATGFRKLGIPKTEMPEDPRFHHGMKAVRNTRLNPRIHTDYPLSDPPYGQWEEFYQSDIDLAILLADEDKGRLEATLTTMLDQTHEFTEAHHVEHGTVIERDGQKIEHFGFVDGISQPIFFREDTEKEIAQRGNQYWDPGAPISVVLSEDYKDSSSFGSYFVFRKLEQNVQGFHDATLRLAEATHQSAEVAAALVVGRFRDGTPLIPSEANDAVVANDFQYDKDIYGIRCPYHAHIRKSNPRGDIARKYSVNVPQLDFEKFERNHRIVRRGVPYGARPDLADESLPKPMKDVGLLFMAHCSELFNFELCQTALDDENFVRDEIGVDPLVGHVDKPIPQMWPTPNANKGLEATDKNIPSRFVPFRFGSYVTLKGGEYFFSPSIAFLRNLAN